MKKRARAPSARTERRALERGSVRLAEDRIRLAALEAGGSPAMPITVESASIVEPRAESFSCLRCGAETRTEEHTAETRGGKLLRAVETRCKHCAQRRTIWFDVAPRLTH